MQPFDRQAAFQVGATFSRGEDGTELFTFTSDGSSIIGPREATEVDRTSHEVAYAAFQATEAEALERDRLAAAEAQRVGNLEAELEIRTAERDGAVARASAAETRLAELIDALEQLEGARRELAAKVTETGEAHDAAVARAEAAEKRVAELEAAAKTATPAKSR